MRKTNFEARPRAGRPPAAGPRALGPLPVGGENCFLQCTVLINLQDTLPRMSKTSASGRLPPGSDLATALNTPPGTGLHRFFGELASGGRCRRPRGGTEGAPLTRAANLSGPLLCGAARASLEFIYLFFVAYMLVFRLGARLCDFSVKTSLYSHFKICTMLTSFP